MSITIEEARKLSVGDYIYHTTKTYSDGKTHCHCRVNGAVKFWKTRPHEYRIPYKYGMYEFGYITPSDTCFTVHNPD